MIRSLKDWISRRRKESKEADERYDEMKTRRKKLLHDLQDQSDDLDRTLRGVLPEAKK